MSSVVLAELRYRAESSAHTRKNHARLDLFIDEMRCVDFDADASHTYGRVRRSLEEQGRPIGPYDMLIAAHALSLGLIIITDNVREFRRVSGLKIENWREA